MDITTAIKESQEHFDNPPPNEAATCEWVILPLLYAAGYGRRDVLAKSFDNGGKFPDYTLLPDDPKHMFYLEAKAWELGLEDGHANQALNYANQNGKRWVVLTNGQNWRLYDNDIRGRAKDKLVTEIALKDKDDALRLFEAIGKESVCADRLGQFATDETIRRKRVAEERELLVQQENRRQQVATIWKQELQQDQSPLIEAIVSHLNGRPGLEMVTTANVFEVIGSHAEPGGIGRPGNVKPEPGDNQRHNAIRTFEQIAKEALLKAGTFEIVHEKLKQVTFIPWSWAKLALPKGIAKYSRNFKSPVSVACYLGCRPPRGKPQESRVTLRFGVRPMEDAKLRLDCVTSLVNAFGPVREPLSDDPRWSTFFSDKQRVSDPKDEGEIRAAIDELLARAKAKFSLAQAALAKVFQSRGG